MTITYAWITCRDCDRPTTIASNEPPENRRCVRCYQDYLRSQP